MKEFKVKIGENGRINIPALYRKTLKLVPGDEVILRMDECEIHMMSVKRALTQAQTAIQAHTKHQSLLQSLHDLRQEDE